MGSLLIRNAEVLVTMSGDEIKGGGVYSVDGLIRRVGPTGELPQTADRTFDATGHVVMPGLVNTHHHLYQTLTRVVPGAQDAGLFDWLRTLYPIWARMTPDHVRVATTLGLAELALSGCTTAFDHQYLWPNGSTVEDQFDGADPVGIRFHASRGSMSLGESAGGLPPDSVVQDEASILSDSADVVERFHDPSPGSMRRVVLAPCSPFSVTGELMSRTAELARHLGVAMHTHLAETADEEEFCLATVGRRPVEYMEDLGWVGPDVWYAHAVHVSPDEISRMAADGTGVAHCPTSNMRLASGIAPIRDYSAAGVRVGLGVDGSASNDGSNMIAETRQALLLSRLSVAPGVGSGAQMTAREALRLATLGGAQVLGRDDIGTLEPGKQADLVAFSTSGLEFSGAAHDPVAAVVMVGAHRAAHTWVAGEPVVADGSLVGVDLEALTADHRRLSAGLVG